MLARALAGVADAHGEALREAFGTEVTVPSVPFPRITMAEAQETLRTGGWAPEGDKEDLDPEGERGVASYIQAVSRTSR